MQKSMKTMARKRRFPRVPCKDAPAGKPPAEKKIWETLEARLDEQSEEIEVLMKAAGLERVSAQATERSKMMDYFDKTKEECNRLLAMMNEVTVKMERCSETKLTSCSIRYEIDREKHCRKPGQLR